MKLCKARLATDPRFDHGVSGGEIHHGDALSVLRTLESASVRCCVTSPPYWGLRDYGYPRQIGSEPLLDEYTEHLTDVFHEVYRVLTSDGTIWLNIGDSFTSGNRGRRATDRKNPAREMTYRPPTPKGLKPKDLIGIPWRIAFALQRDGWYLRSDIIWNKPNCQPESVRDRPTRSHEYLFLLTKSKRYYYDQAAIMERANGDTRLRNRRTVWNIHTEQFPGAHFATFPEALVKSCILAGSEPGDIVLDPFFGAGTVGLVSIENRRRFIGIELKEEYVRLARRRLGRCET